MLIYQHLDSIGHGVIFFAIAGLMVACFSYAARHRAPYTWGQAPKTSVGADYLLLLGCLLFVVLEGYVQYQYNVFGNRYGLVTVVPALFFLPLAYRFDHRGVLSMGITALTSWVGLTVAPLAVFANNDFWNDYTQRAALGLGLLLMTVGFCSEHLAGKPHFAFTYLLLGSNLTLSDGEHVSLTAVVQQRRVASKRLVRAQCLLALAPNGRGWTDAQTARAHAVSTRTRERLRQRACEAGIEAALLGQPR